MIQERCKILGCPNYIEWSFYGKDLVSCKLQGESDTIEQVADDCPFKDRFKKEQIVKALESLNGDGNTVRFIRGNDGDICISFCVPKAKVFLECVRVGVGNSGGQEVPAYIKVALSELVNAFEKWEKEEE